LAGYNVKLVTLLLYLASYKLQLVTFLLSLSGYRLQLVKLVLSLPGYLLQVVTLLPYLAGYTLLVGYSIAVFKMLHITAIFGRLHIKDGFTNTIFDKVQITAGYSIVFVRLHMIAM
jgi:hypothetical protein